MDLETHITLYRYMLTARQIDLAEERLCRRGLAFFHLSGAGHEAVVGLAPHLKPSDWLHSHYRSRSLLLAKGIRPQSFFDNLLGKNASNAHGRRMGAFFSDPQRNVLSMTTLVGNNALQSVGVASAVRSRPGQPIVVCGLGDGTTQQGEFLEACGEASRRKVPVLFLVEDNGFAISTRTHGNTFYANTSTDGHFYGIPLLVADGTCVETVHDVLGDVVSRMRSDRCPAVVVLQLERLCNHSNADDQQVYRAADELAEISSLRDPIRRVERKLMSLGISDLQLRAWREEVAAEIAVAEGLSLQGKEPEPVLDAVCSLPVALTHTAREFRGNGTRDVVMRDAIRDVLMHHLRVNPRVSLLGQDIEDPKGDVFGVTRGLSTEFPDRVTNAALSESTILGVSIGRALAGERPVAMIQFADFLPLAFNQIVSEMATMFWRTGGGWHSPVIVLAACGGYRPGLGPFHAQSGEGYFVHTPGLDVFMPSHATDAAGMLNAAFASGRPTLFLYPKAILNNPQLSTSRDVSKQFVPIGTARCIRAGRDLTLVGWGNTVSLCNSVSQALEQAGVEAEVLDLRSLAPWDQRSVLASAEKTARLIVVHEDNHSCGVGAEILATVAEHAKVPVAMRRVTRSDTHIPCHFGNQMDVLPSFSRILSVAADMLDLELTWDEDARDATNIATIRAIGSSPSDESVVVVELLVAAGESIQQGQAIASVEATKSVFDLTSSVTGKIAEILAVAGQTLRVGEPLMRVHVDSAATANTATCGSLPLDPGRPHFKRRASSERIRLPRRDHHSRRYSVGFSSIATVEGSRIVTNEELVFPRGEFVAEDIVRRTGIEQRRWVGHNEDAVSMAAQASRQVLEKERLILEDIDLLICSTTSPSSVTPSTACRVLNALTQSRGEIMLQAYDINAACSGYLYALQAGYDFLQSRPQGRVLVVTTEVLSPLLNRDDFDTAILFGDAASATVLYGEAWMENSLAEMYRPELSAKGDKGDVLSVPFLRDGFIQMQGRRVFHEAVRTMITSLTRVCDLQQMSIDKLDLIVPHQANQRILDAIQSRVQARVCSNIRQYGNTSSSSIPLCLAEVIPTATSGSLLGLCAFGGGFTFGASILQMN